MVVEFLGLPGAGKSTLAHCVAEHLVGQDFLVVRSPRVLSHESGKIERILGKAGPLAKHMMRRPSHALRVTREILATQQRTGADLIRTLANWLYVEALLQHGAAGAKVQLVEQGMGQALWSIGFSAGNGAWVDMIRQPGVLITPPNLVVLIEAEMSTIHRRLVNRPARARVRQERGILIMAVRNEDQADLAASAAAVATRILSLWGGCAATV
jgi:hypothetical protein